MSKKNKKSTLQPKSPLKVLLPVLIGLAVIAITCTIISIASRPVESAKVENPNEVYLQVGNYKVTKQQVYEALRASGGISTFTFLMDSEILKDVVVTDEDIEEARKKAVYGDEIIAQEEELAELKEELAAETDDAKKAELEAEIAEFEEDLKEAKEDAERSYNFNFSTLGYETEEAKKAYFTVLAKRNVYAEKAYREYVEKNDFTKDQYIAASKAEDSSKYENTSFAIAIVFQNEAQAKAYLTALSKPVDSADLSNGWKFLNDKNEKATLNEEIKELKDTIEKLEKELETTPDAEKAAKQEAIDEAKASLASKEAGLEGLKDPVAMTDHEITLAFVELYNYAYAYYLGGDVSEYFNKDAEGAYTTLKEEYQILKEGVHYEVKTETVTKDETTTEVKTVVFNKENLDKLSEEIEFCKFVYTDAEAKSTLSTAVYDTLVATADKKEDDTKATKNYTYSPTKAGSGLYYLAYKFGSQAAVETSEYEDVLKAIETLEKAISEATDEAVKAEKEAELKAKKDYVANLKEQLIEENYNNNQQTRMLVEKRQASGLVIYDRYLNASYKAAYEYLYETTLKWKEDQYEAYASDGKKHKTLAFSYKNNAGEVVEYTAEELFVELNKLYASQVSQQFIVNYAILSNEDYNKIYNPYTKKIYDRDNYKALINSDYSNIYSELLSGSIKSVQSYKYAFELDLFATYGFGKDYGWKAFLRDYLLLKDEKALVGYLATSYAVDELQLSKIKYEDVLAEMQEIYDAYYSVKGINLIVTVDYNNDSTPDNYVLEGEQTHWTEYQIGLVQELTNLIYEKRDLASESAKDLEAKLKEIADLYNKATFEDATWGKYVAAGLKVEVEKAADYKNSDSLVQEFHDELAKLYAEAEKAEGYAPGAWTDEEKAAGYQKVEVFATQYGFHRVTLINANERVYVNKDKSLDLNQLTIEMYKKYLEDTASYDETTTKAITTYLDPAMNNVYTENESSLFQLALCEQLVADKEIEFKDSNLLAKYTQYEASYRAYIEALIADEAESE